MKRCWPFLAAITLVACATSIAPGEDGVRVGGGVEAGDEGNPYGGDDAGTEAGNPMVDSGPSGQDAGTTETGTAADTGATDTGTTTAPGVCAKTSLQQFEYGADIVSGSGTDCSASVSACASGQCCYQGSVKSLCVTQ